MKRCNGLWMSIGLRTDSQIPASRALSPAVSDHPETLEEPFHAAFDLYVLVRMFSLFLMMALDLVGSSCCRLRRYLRDWRGSRPRELAAGIAEEGMRAPFLEQV